MYDIFDIEDSGDCIGADLGDILSGQARVAREKKKEKREWR